MLRRNRTPLMVSVGLAALALVACANWTGNREEADGSVGVDGGGSGDHDAGVCEPAPALGPGDQCDVAIDVGDLSDVAAGSITIGGNGVPVGRSTWWKFRAIDDADPTGDSFHVDARFVDNPDDGYEMDVYRGGCTAADRLCEHTSGPFDWYTDQPFTETGCSGPPPCGEGNCTSQPDVEGANSCDDDTSVFYVVVRRADGQGSCDTFSLELSNGLYSAP